MIRCADRSGTGAVKICNCINLGPININQVNRSPFFCDAAIKLLGSKKNLRRSIFGVGAEIIL